MSEIDTTGDHWSEDYSAQFIELGELFVPGRAEQLRTLVDLLPAQPSEIFTVVELGAGAGHLAYDEIVREQSLAQRGDLSGYEQFREMQWNYFIYDYGSTNPDSIDHPSPLSEQISWLSEAGFSTASCFWMRAGHAIYGGYK